MSSSVGGASLNVLFSTGTEDATWDCTDSQGHAYCVSTARDELVKTDGATYSNITTAPKGTMVTVTPERLVISGISATPNQIDFSKSNDFTEWTVGTEPTDPNQETVTAPGGRITHITYCLGNVVWFKDVSMGYIIEGQTILDWEIITVDPTRGTLDNESLCRSEGLYFRGQDGHMYFFNGAFNQKLSDKVESTIKDSQVRRSNSFLLTSQSDWEAGTQDPSGSFDTTTTPGDLLNKTTSWVVTTESDMDRGTLTGSATEYADLETEDGSVIGAFPDFFSTSKFGEAGTFDLWDNYDPNGSGSIGLGGGELQLDEAEASGPTGVRTAFKLKDLLHGTTLFFRVTKMDPENTGGGTPRSGRFVFEVNTGTTHQTGDYWYWQFEQTTTAGTYAMSGSDSSSGDTGLDISSTTTTMPLDFLVYLDTTTYNFSYSGGHSHGGNHTWAPSPDDAYLYIYSNGVNGAFEFDLTFAQVATPKYFVWTSTSLDTGITTPYWDVFNLTETDPSNMISYLSEVSADDSSFDTAVSETPASKLAAGNKRYIKIGAKYEFLDHALAAVPEFEGFDTGAWSSGTYRSASFNSSGITQWDTFQADFNEVEGSSVVFYVRTSTNSIDVDSSTPTWTQVDPGMIPTASTGTYIQMRADFNATESSHTPSIQLMSLSWFEGNASDKYYISHYEDAIWYAVASGTGVTVNNKVLRFDLLNQVWTLYDIPINGFITVDQNLYFGDSGSGNVYIFGDTNSDNGTDIEAYWKSKDFITESPFIEKEYTRISVSAKSVQFSTVTVTYDIDGTETAYDIGLTETSKPFTHNNRNLPAGKRGDTINIKIGNDDSRKPFEIYAIQYDYRPKPWRPTPR